MPALTFVKLVADRVVEGIVRRLLVRCDGEGESLFNKSQR